MMGTWVGWIGLCGAVALILASCGSGQYPASSPQAAAASEPVALTQVVGLWHSNFGPVKIESDDSRGGSHLMGIWVYDRNGAEVVGYFQGELGGNVLHLKWHEPGEPAPLTGDGYLVFDPAGSKFAGRWWTGARDRQGEWNGWRPENGI